MDQLIVFITLGVALLFFIWGKIRFDIVALLALLFLVVMGIVPAADAFSGFGHPAVITVAAVLIVSRALQDSGLVDVISKFLDIISNKLLAQIALLSVIVAIASAFMNNIGALAILMPVAIHLARKNGHSPSYLLMPMAFASLLGGMTTLIGTPPNIIIATFRADILEEPFGMFDFSKVGVFVALAGLIFMVLIGWMLIPRRKSQTSEEDMFDIENYITEVKITTNSKIKGKTISEVEDISDADVVILGMVRDKKRIHAPSGSQDLKTNDILILEADTDSLKSFVDNTKTGLVGGKKFHKDAKGSDDILIQEAVVTENSPLINETAAGLRMRSRYGINLLAVARHDTNIRQRIDHVKFRTGDVLLLQGRSININDAIMSMQCLPLAKRELSIGKKRKTFFALSVFSISIILVVTGLLPVQIAFSLAAVTMVLSKILHVKDLYNSIDWPVIILLGAMIPVGVAFETTGGAMLITEQIIGIGQQYPPWLLLTIMLVITMLLSDLINNAATVVLMAPIAINTANELGVSIDPFLMAVAIGGSCAFLTPVGHQSNTLVMGPGGYKFGDYWRAGLPLEIIIVAVGVPLLMFFWPL